MRAVQTGSPPLRIGMIGLDNSRVVAFARMLEEEDHPHRVAGARLVAAWPGIASEDFAMSAGRQGGYVAELRDRLGVPMTETIDEVAERCDALMLEAVDGRTRPELFERLVACGKPIFVDKPFALSAADAERMLERAAACGTPVMSCSALRYAAALSAGLEAMEGPVAGADFYGPMALEPTQPGYFWYGIHTAEMLFRSLGPSCAAVRATRTAEHDVAVAVWENGRIGTIRGNRVGNERFGGTLHGRAASREIEVREGDKPFLASLLEEIVAFFATGRSPVDPRETLAIVRFLEAANRSLRENRTVRLAK